MVGNIFFLISYVVLFILGIILDHLSYRLMHEYRINFYLVSIAIICLLASAIWSVYEGVFL